MALAGFVLYRERLGWPFLGGVALAFFGLYLLVGRLVGGRRAVPARRRCSAS